MDANSDSLISQLPDTGIFSNASKPTDEGVKIRESEKLLAHLQKMSEDLPDQSRQYFDEHDLLLRMETLRRKLKGYQGLHTLAGNQPKKTTTISIPKVIDTLGFLKDLAGEIPEERIGLALTSKITHIVDSIRREPHG